MSSTLQEKLQESLNEWENIQRAIKEQKAKDAKIIRDFCSKNTGADIRKTISHLLNYDGISSSDRAIVERFKNMYPDSLTTEGLKEFTEVRHGYREYLLNGGDDDA